MKTLNVDVSGEKMSLPQYDIVGDHGQLRFVVDESMKQGMKFHWAAFFTKALLDDSVFRYPRSRRLAVLTESPIDNCYKRMSDIVRRFPVIFTHQRDLIDRGPPFLPLIFGTNWIGVRDVQETNLVLQDHPVKTEMTSFIGSLNHPDRGAYRFRREVAEFALQRDDIACFGKGIRPLPGKREAIEPYRFSIAMENAAVDYYFSEKLIDCLLLETVPIYYGCPAIREFFDARGLLCFNSHDELRAILDTLSPALYEQMRPFVVANKLPD